MQKNKHILSNISTKILCIETANAVTSIAITENNNCLCVKTLSDANKAADSLHTLLASMLAEQHLKMNDLHAIAISAGPGSYTGLRIAVAAAKAYCFALDIPLIAISTLESMVHGVQTRYHQNEYDVFVPMIDARRMEVFAAFYNQKSEKQQTFSGLIIDANFPELLDANKKYLLFGNGAIKTSTFINKENSTLFTDFSHCASDLCSLAFYHFVNKQFEEIAYFEPNYTKQVHITSQKK
ncbi:MAG: tRNA (adenosine(37)-N6)-threonylcarbamoyltransferase complex dimerization subunit type 1 TsaB [Chitinophagales bacterium]|nr:tRNA (adenosine(37)-N6)-threonylcarbamoyltransferase complex dimerization subunit type 1 TsaB [Chitinophagales bacterium]MBP6153549.1 tRNA (adenosine(37)-N6)-threonylcarbamoyltransferase complex dimerization subunit type 1 TsaB [Chitinophagales bacterium]